MGAKMKSASGASKISAAAVAISVTFAIVWSMASLGYPGLDTSFVGPIAATKSVRVVQ